MNWAQIVNINTKSENFKTHLLVCLLLAVFILLPYSQARNHEFLDLDDYEYIVNNRYVNSGFTVDGLIWAFSFQQDDKYYWRPLTWVSHMLDFHIFGNAAGWHHITNFLLHILNSFLLYAFLLILTKRIGLSAIVATLFAVHPLNVESVAWLTERNNVLCTFFGLNTLVFYARYAKNPFFSKYMLVFIFFTLCLMTKPILITLPFLMMLLDYWPLNRFQSYLSNSHDKKKIWFLLVEKIPLIILLTIAVWLSLKRHGNPISIEQVPLNLRLSNGIVAYVEYILKFIYPVKLSAFYPFPKTIPLTKLLAAASIILSITYIVVSCVKKAPYLFVGWFWYLGTMIPQMGLVQVGLWPAFADRWAYFPMIGLFIIIACLTTGLYQKVSRIPKIIIFFQVSSVLVVLIYFTWSQVGVWANSYSLFSHMIEINGKDYLAHNNLGFLYVKQKNMAQAEYHIRKSVELNPDYETAILNLGILANERGDFTEAFEHFNRVLVINPDSTIAHLALANLLIDKGQGSGAFEHYTKALQIDPDSAVVYTHVGIGFAKVGRLDEAVACFQKALSLEPGLRIAEEELKKLTETAK